MGTSGAGESRSSRGLVAVAVVVLACLTLAFGGTALWAVFRTDPQVTDLENQVSTLQAQVQESGATADQVATLQAQVDKLKAGLASAVPADSLPVVAYLPFDRWPRPSQQQEFQRRLVDPMVAYVDGKGHTVLSVLVEVPAQQGDPYVYTAVTTYGSAQRHTYGALGEPLPKWTPPCGPDECFGFD